VKEPTADYGKLTLVDIIESSPQPELGIRDNISEQNEVSAQNGENSIRQSVEDWINDSQGTIEGGK